MGRAEDLERSGGCLPTGNTASHSESYNPQYCLRQRAEGAFENFMTIDICLFFFPIDSLHSTLSTLKNILDHNEAKSKINFYFS